jgi:hypothetical protein
MANGKWQHVVVFRLCLPAKREPKIVENWNTNVTCDNETTTTNCLSKSSVCVSQYDPHKDLDPYL